MWDLPRRIGRGLRALVGHIRFINPLSGHVVADREAMFGDDPANDPRRMDFDPNRRPGRRR
jgi:hypothetical protein